LGGFKNLVFYKDLYTHYLKQIGTEHTISSQRSIPKIIHYCWFGHNQPTEKMKKCMDSWYKFLPDYSLTLWNEDNFPFEKYPFAEQAYKHKQYAFVADVARLYALHYYGGIYMDTDVEVIKPLDEFLQYGAFSSYETNYLISTGIIGAKQNNNWIRLLLSWYDGLNYSKYYKNIANTKIISKITELHYGIKLKKLSSFILPNDDLRIFPREWCPSRNITENSYCIHHFTGSWKS